MSLHPAYRQPPTLILYHWEHSWTQVCCYVCKSSRSVMHYRELDINRQHNLYLSNHQCIFFNIFFVLFYFMNKSWKVVANILWSRSMKHHGLSQKYVTKITTIFLEAWTSSIALDDKQITYAQCSWFSPLINILHYQWWQPISSSFLLRNLTLIVH